jgi:hypothetical protein
VTKRNCLTQCGIGSAAISISRGEPPYITVAINRLGRSSEVYSKRRSPPSVPINAVPVSDSASTSTGVLTVRFRNYSTLRRYARIYRTAEFSFFIARQFLRSNLVDLAGNSYLFESQLACR